MNVRNTIKGLAAASLCVGMLSGCASTVLSVSTMFMPNEIDKLEAQERSLTPRYKAKVESFQREIDRGKEGIDASLEAKDILESSKKLKAFYELTHPCGEDDCETFPCEVCGVDERSKEKLQPLNRAEVFIEREGIDNERAFIRSSMELFLELSSESLEKGEDELVNTTLDHIHKNLPFASSYRSRFADLAFKAKASIIATLVGDAKSLELNQPHLAAKKYARAAKLSEEIGEDRQASDFKAKALSLGG